MASLVKSVNGEIYLSGGHTPIAGVSSGKAGSAADYNDSAVYEAYRVNLRYQNFTHPVYEQNVPEFVPGLSAFDAMVRFGPKTLEMIRVCNPREDVNVA
jgi:hypothetical protein